MEEISKIEGKSSALSVDVSSNDQVLEHLKGQMIEPVSDEKLTNIENSKYVHFIWEVQSLIAIANDDINSGLVLTPHQKLKLAEYIEQLSDKISKDVTTIESGLVVNCKRMLLLDEKRTMEMDYVRRMTAWSTEETIEPRDHRKVLDAVKSFGDRKRDLKRALKASRKTLDSLSADQKQMVYDRLNRIMTMISKYDDLIVATSKSSPFDEELPIRYAQWVKYLFQEELLSVGATLRSLRSLSDHPFGPMLLTFKRKTERVKVALARNPSVQIRDVEELKGDRDDIGVVSNPDKTLLGVRVRIQRHEDKLRIVPLSWEHSDLLDDLLDPNLLKAPWKDSTMKKKKKKKRVRKGKQESEEIVTQVLNFLSKA